ncbi:DUF503 family protein [Oscillibacter sp.]|uniref:DUF503 family protein n=1 Tax=Oscillibacter sp. TaxID=1945593 RepID=UPI00289E4B36|nr:DUF503 family protein [Oscillibacter sp.]
MLISKAKNKFSVSISKVAAQAIHQTIVLGLACVTGTVLHADSMIDSILKSIEVQRNQIGRQLVMNILC